MILYSQRAIDDLAEIRSANGRSTVLMLMRWCESLDEPGTRAEAERLGGDTDVYRLRVDHFYILFVLDESRDGDSIHITRIRRRR